MIQKIEPKPKYHRVVPMMQYFTLPATQPGKLGEKQELYLPMVLLTGAEDAIVEASCYQDTLKLFNNKSPKIDEPSNYKEQLEAQRAYWTIYMTCRLPDDLNVKYFESKQHVESLYGWDEAGILMAHYLSVRMTQPQFSKVDVNDPQAMQKMIAKIKLMGGDSDFYLNGVTSHAINQLIKYLIAEREQYIPSPDGI